MNVQRKAVWGTRVALAGALAAAALTAGCGDVVRQGEGSSYLIVNSIEAASGHEPEEYFSALIADVFTVVDDRPGVYGDPGRVTLSLAMKDPGITSPTSANAITLYRYHVRYFRTDGRNTPGVDVPYPFDGGLTATIVGSPVSVGFQLTRIVAKEEAPLRALRTNGVFLDTIAEVTFYGRDQTGREVSVIANIQVLFGNFADPE